MAGVNICPKINLKQSIPQSENLKTGPSEFSCSLRIKKESKEAFVLHRWVIHFSLSEKCLFYVFKGCKCDFSTYFSTSVWSKTVYHMYKFLKRSISIVHVGSETACHQRDRQTAFYSPLQNGHQTIHKECK